MGVVGAATDADVDDGTCGASVLCEVVVCLNAKLGDGVRGGRDSLIGKPWLEVP